MQGNHARGLAFYRCRLTSGDYAAPPVNHPRTIAVREDRILPVLDQWLAGMFSPDRIGDVASRIVAADRIGVGEDRAADAARRTIAAARRKLDSYLAALEAGMDPELVTSRTKAAQAEIAAAQAVLDGAQATRPALTKGEVVEVLAAVAQVPDLLQNADIELRADLYRSLGLQLAYRRERDLEYLQVAASIGAVDLERVGGGTLSLTTPAFETRWVA
jgi:hypothetical protein